MSQVSEKGNIDSTFSRVLEDKKNIINQLIVCSHKDIDDIDVFRLQVKNDIFQKIDEFIFVFPDSNSLTKTCNETFVYWDGRNLTHDSVITMSVESVEPNKEDIIV